LNENIRNGKDEVSLKKKMKRGEKEMSERKGQIRQRMIKNKRMKKGIKKQQTERKTKQANF
jgi:hypothetical protein